MIKRLNKNLWEITIGERKQKVVGTIYDARRVELQMMFKPLRSIENAQARQRQVRSKFQKINRIL